MALSYVDMTNKLIRFSDYPKGGISSHAKNRRREPIQEELKRAKEPPRWYWPSDQKRSRAS